MSPTIYIALSNDTAKDIYASSFGEAAYVSKGIAEYLALELKEDKKLFYTVEKCMQGLYYNQPDIAMAFLTIEKETILIKQMVKFND